MAQENTAINDLIHLVTAPKIERESQEEIFWVRDRANLRRPTSTPAPGSLVPVGAAQVSTQPLLPGPTHAGQVAGYSAPGAEYGPASAAGYGAANAPGNPNGMATANGSGLVPVGAAHVPTQAGMFSSASAPNRVLHEQTRAPNGVLPEQATRAPN